VKTNTADLYDKLEAYLKRALEDMVAEHNAKDPELYLEDIKAWHRGYKDVTSGATEFPAILFMEQSRTQLDSFTTRYSVEISIALKGSERIAEQGQAYTDALWDALLADCHLGDACLDSNNHTLETGYIGSVFLAVATLDIDMDRGGFL